MDQPMESLSVEQLMPIKGFRSCFTLLNPHCNEKPLQGATASPGPHSSRYLKVYLMVSFAAWPRMVKEAGRVAVKARCRSEAARGRQPHSLLAGWQPTLSCVLCHSHDAATCRHTELAHHIQRVFTCAFNLLGGGVTPRGGFQPGDFM